MSSGGSLQSRAITSRGLVTDFYSISESHAYHNSVHQDLHEPLLFTGAAGECCGAAEHLLLHTLHAVITTTHIIYTRRYATLDRIWLYDLTISSLLFVRIASPNVSYRRSAISALQTVKRIVFNGYSMVTQWWHSTVLSDLCRARGNVLQLSYEERQS